MPFPGLREVGSAVHTVRERDTAVFGKEAASPICTHKIDADTSARISVLLPALPNAFLKVERHYPPYRDCLWALTKGTAAIDSP
jgi:hypothetical protein